MNISKTNNTNNTSLNHIGIIMDGNGRWAKKKMLDRSQGHLNGIQAVKDSIMVSIKSGVSYISIYTFSTENWKRPKAEVNFIMELMAGNLRKHYDFYEEHNVRVVQTGDSTPLSKKLQSEIQKVEENTQYNTAITLNMAFNHGGRDEIIRAIKRYENDAHKKNITEEIFKSYFDKPDIPDVDLLIRTGGDKRISNFMLWHIAYAELYFSDVLWPDWNMTSMKDAIAYYHNKDRRFGGIKT